MDTNKHRRFMSYMETKKKCREIHERIKKSIDPELAERIQGIWKPMGED